MVLSVEVTAIRARTDPLGIQQLIDMASQLDFSIRRALMAG